MSLLIVRTWRTLALRGVFGMLLGVVPFVWPSIALTGLVILFGVYALVDGFLLLASAAQYRSPAGRSLFLAFEGVVGVLVGLVTLLWTGMGALIFINLIGFWALSTGALELMVALRASREVPAALALAATGMASIVFGVLVIGWPNVSAFVVVTLLGSYSLAMGVSMLAFAFRMRSLSRSIQSQREGFSHEPKHAA
jgi:uncharacterized membrane protein HdeD (DUF308 family)